MTIAGFLDAQADPNIGQMIAGRFKITERLGEGGMGVVYKAVQTSIDRLVAIKVLRPRHFEDPSLQGRFRNEALLASRLNHPSTVTIYDFGVIEDGSLYIAMELVSGVSLDSVLSNEGSIDWRRSCNIAIQICESLHDAHSHLIVHRDLKPDNVMLAKIGSRDDRVKVLDFGIAKALQAEPAQNRPNLTAPNQIFGTPAYMSPEQILGEQLDSRTDIYSLGVIVYQMLTGRLPFVAESPVAVMAKHLHKLPPSFAAVSPSLVVPADLEALVMGMIEKSTVDRPADMGVVVQALRLIYGSSIAPPQAARQPEVVQASPVADLPGRGRRSAVSKTAAEAPGQMVAPEQAGPSDTMMVAPEQAGPSDTMMVAPEQAGPSDTMMVAPEQVAPEIPAPVPPPSASPGEEPSGGDPVMPESAPIVEITVSASNGEDVEGEILVSGEPASRKEAIIEHLVGLMKKKKDFPTISKYVSELNTTVSSERSSAGTVANVILKDYALTTKLLKLINSPFYSQVRGNINTVSRAVVMMGFDSVRQSALGLTMFEQLKATNSEHATQMRESALRSLMGGVIARDMAGPMADVNKEEAFVCALFRRLGQHLTLYYMPESAAEIDHLMEAEGLTERKAALRVLGVDYSELGKEIAKLWQFPETLRQSMERLPETNLVRPRSPVERMQQLTGFADELSEVAVMTSPQERNAALKKLETRYQSSFKRPFKANQLDDLLKEGVKSLESYSEVMEFASSQSAYVRKVRFANGENISLLPEPAQQRGAPDKGEAQEEEKPRKRSQLQLERSQLMDVGTEEITNLLKGSFDVNNVMAMVIETMYRGLRFSRVLFCLYDIHNKTMRARAGLGEGVTELIPDFQFLVGRRGDIFSDAMRNAREILVDDVTAPRFASRIPAWYKQHVHAAKFVAYPVCFQSVPAALFYGDHISETAVIDHKLLKKMRILCDTAARAFQGRAGVARPGVRYT